jgi:chromosome segregation ATPase
MQHCIAELELQRKRVQDELSSMELMLGGHESGITNIEQQLRTEATQEAKTEMLSELNHKKKELEQTYKMQYVLKKKYELVSNELEEVMARKQELEQVLKELQDRVSSIQLTAGSIIVETEELEKRVSMETDTNMQNYYRQQLEEKKAQSEKYSYMIKQLQAEVAAVTREM